MKTEALQHLVNLGVWCHNNPKQCNMFEKKCDLLTCHTKNRCLWTKEEVEKLRNPKQ